ncbi:BRCA1 protein, partial [Ancylostoma caninum]
MLVISLHDHGGPSSCFYTRFQVHVPLEVSLKGLSISGNTPSRNPSVVPDSDPIRLEAASEDEQLLNPARGRSSSGGRRTVQSHGLSLRLGESFDESSEEVFIAVENKMKHSLFSVAESCDIAADLHEDSFCNILNGCRVCVEMGCCKESSEDVRSRLRRMGAVVSRRFTETTTHVVFSYGGSTEILQCVFASSRRPFFVDPHWVYECFKRQTRVAEDNFSLYECRYLVDTIRRSLDKRSVSGCRDVVLHDLTNELGHTSHGNVSENVEVTFSRTMNASELLLKLDLLSKRLDKIGVFLFFQLPPHVYWEIVALAFSKAHSTVRITRRRTHGAFPLEYRDPYSDAMKVILESREEQDAVFGRRAAQRFGNLDPPKENKEPRCTQADDLPYTLKKAVVTGTKSTGSKQQKGAAATRSPRKCLAPVENSSELGGLLGLKTPSQCGVYGPLVETASSLINQLQSASSSAEFVGKRHTTRIVSKNSDGIVFTGFIKEKERELHPYVRELGLKVHAKISGRTYCVVSANGERTLNTMRAVVSGISVVTQEWIEMCVDHNRLLPLDEYEHVRWKELIRKRGQNCALFTDYGKI